MRRFIGVIVLLAAIGVFAATKTGDYALVRPAGTATITGAGMYLICDSSDTFQVDTFYSDTVLLDTSTHWLNYVFTGHTHTLADSANDSVEVIVLTYTSYGYGKAKRLIDTDTFPTNPLVLNDTIWNFLNVDTLVFTRLWFETIVSDSFIADAGVDTTHVRFTYEVLQK